MKQLRTPENFPDLIMVSDSSDSEAYDSDSDYCADSDGDSNACSQGAKKDDVPLPAPELLTVEDC